MAGSSRRPRSRLLTIYWLAAAAAAVLLWPVLSRWHFDLHGASSRPSVVAWALALGLGTLVAVAVASGLRALRSGEVRRRFIFSHVLGALLVLTTWGGTRIALGATVPRWPARDLRPIVPQVPAPARPAAHNVFNDMPWLHGPYNDWGMRDRPRTRSKSAGTSRVVMIGDSFLEGGFCRQPLNLVCEAQLAAAGVADVECVNLGVSATGPPHYYHRLQKVAAALEPDAVFLFVYAGNDFVGVDESFTSPDNSVLARLVAELPKPSLLGELLPELNWFLVNQLKLSEFQAGLRKGTVRERDPDEFQHLFEITQRPFAEGSLQLAEYVHRWHLPEREVAVLHELFGRGGEPMWSQLRWRRDDPEFLQSYILVNLVAWELGQGPYPKTLADVPPEHVEPAVRATASWVEAAFAACGARKVPLVVFLAPVGVVDPEFVEFWKPWPRQYSFNLTQDARHRALRAALAPHGAAVVDLRDVLDGLPGTYRKTDAHWNERGHELVARRVVQEIVRLRTAQR